VVRLECAQIRSGIRLIYRRELNEKETDAPSLVGIQAGATIEREFNAPTPVEDEAADVRAFYPTFEFLQNGIQAGMLRFKETFLPRSSEQWVRETIFSTDGLSVLLRELRSICMAKLPLALQTDAFSVGRGGPTSTQARAAIPPAPTTPPADTLSWKSEYFIIGRQLRVIKQSTRDQCAKICLDENKCRAIEFIKHSQFCGLYSSVTFAGPGGSADVGLR
jgi:hypothetical protein